MLNSKKSVVGFTLIEIMIAISIIAILVAIAIPSYSSYSRRANRSDAIALLNQNAQALERCYSGSFSYTSANCPATVTTSQQQFYQITNPTIAATSYSITAKPVAGKQQAKDTTCASFTITDAGTQTALDTSGNDQSKVCWGSR